MDTLLSVMLGLGLSASCGFRVFVPLLIMSLAANSGHLELAEGFAWIGSDLSTTVLVIATLLEIGGYYVPWLDNLLDTVATPAAVIAGIVVTASCVTDMSPVLQWSLAAIGGGGAAGVVQGGTAVLRLASTATTGGLANPIVATTESGGAIGLSLLAIVAPVIGFLVVVAAVGMIAYKLKRRKKVPARELVSD